MYKRLLTDTIIYGIGAILPRVITFLFNPFYTKNFDEINQFAQFTQLYAIVSMVNILLTFGFETAYFRFSADKDKEKSTFNTSFWFLLINALVFLMLVLLFNQPIANFFKYPNNPEYIRWLAIIAVFDTLCVIPFAWLRFHNRPIKYSAVRVVQILFQSVLILAFFLWIPTDFLLNIGLKEKVAYPIFSNVLSAILGFLLLLPVILKVKLNFDKELFKKMIPYAFPVMIAGFAFMINENFDKIIQRFLISEESAGAYGACYKLAVLMTLFVTAYRMGVEPFFFKQMNQENAKETYAKVTEYFVIVGSLIVLGIITNIAWLKHVLIKDPIYFQAIGIVPIVVMANLFFGIYYNLSTWYKVTDQTKFGTYISWIGAAITLLLNLILLPKYGFMVSAWATLLAYFVMFVLSYYLGQKYYPIPYKIKKILFYLILSIGLSMLSYLVFDSNIWIGNLLLLIFVVVAYFIEKKSLQLNEN